MAYYCDLVSEEAEHSKFLSAFSAVDNYIQLMFVRKINVINKRMVARKENKNRVANQTRRQVKNLTIILTNKKQKVQAIVSVNIRMSVNREENVGSCIYRNELILGNLMCVEW